MRFELEATKRSFQSCSRGSELRIAIVTHQFFPRYYTGVERLALNLANQLQRMGHECLVVTAAEHAGTKLSYAFDGVAVCGVVAGEADLAAPWNQSSQVRDELRRVFSEFGADVVHIMHPMRLPRSFEAADDEGIPVVAHVADFGYLCPRINMLRIDGSVCFDGAAGQNCVDACHIPTAIRRFAWGKDLLASAAAVITPCRFTQELHESNGFPTHNWAHIPWGVDYAHHNSRLPAPVADELIVAFVGTVLPHKGPHIPIEAVRMLPGAPIRLVVHGGSFHEDDYEAELRRRAADDDRIVFAGAYTHERFRDVLRDVDLVVIPSLWHENLPTSGLNALAAGVPLAVSDMGGLRELIEDYHAGFTFPAGNPASLAALFDRFVADQAILPRLREAMLYPPGVEEEAWLIEGVYRRVASRSPAPVPGNA